MRIPQEKILLVHVKEIPGLPLHTHTKVEVGSHENRPFPVELIASIFSLRPDSLTRWLVLPYGRGPTVPIDTSSVSASCITLHLSILRDAHALIADSPDPKGRRCA